MQRMKTKFRKTTKTPFLSFSPSLLNGHHYDGNIGDRYSEEGRREEENKGLGTKFVVTFLFWRLNLLLFLLVPLLANSEWIMDATQRVVCNGDLINPLFTLGVEMSCILVLSHFFHLVLKPFGQPGPIAQILVSTSLNTSKWRLLMLIIFHWKRALQS